MGRALVHPIALYHPARMMTLSIIQAGQAADSGGSLIGTLAEFVESQPLGAAVVAAVLVALLLLLLRKLFNVALLAIVFVAVIAGVLVYLVGPGQAQAYLEELQQKSSEYLENIPLPG